MTDLHTPEQPYPGQPVVQPSMLDRSGPQLVGYARVSTRLQDPGPQVAALEAAGCARVYVDYASGANAARPQLRAALDYLRPGDTLVCTRLDRVGRSVIHFVYVVEDLIKRKINLRSLDQGIDLDTPQGRMLAMLFVVLAELERQWIAERTQAKIDLARAAGRKGGTKPKLTGKRLVSAQAMMGDDSLSLGEIARRLGVSRATLHRALPDEVRARRERASRAVSKLEL